MLDQYFVYGTAAVILTLIILGMARRSFDPFAPIWLFVVGYGQVYVFQAISHRDYALRARGIDLTTQANARALWALLWFLAVYYSGISRLIARNLPSPPRQWSTPLITAITPVMIVWGLFCSGIEIITNRTGPMSAEESLFRSFPIFMLVAAILLIVTGRLGSLPRPVMTGIGVAVAALYVVIWTFNGKRSHPLFGVLTAVCAFYISKGKRPSKPVLAATAVAGALVVSLAIGWRNNLNYEQSFTGFTHYISEFDPSSILVNMNLKPREGAEGQAVEPASYETEEYGGFLLMMDTVPVKSDYDYGASYLRVFSTYIPRIVWPSKPIYGRQQWVNAWIAGSEYKRDEDFTGPGIGILGATQLNGGAWGTAIVLAVLALLLRSSYDYFRRYATTPWVQAWWALTYYNAWLMTVNDDPFVWFYYVYGHTTLPPMAFLWIYNKLASPGVERVDLGAVRADESPLVLEMQSR